MTREVDPKRLAAWTLERLTAQLRNYVHEYYDQMEHSALFMSPREAYAQGMQFAGARSHRMIPYSDAFLMQTRPTTRTGEFKIEQAKAKSEQEWQQLVEKPHAFPNGSSNHSRVTSIPQSQPAAPVPRSGKRIGRAAHRDPVGTEATSAVREASSKCSFFGPISVTNQQFQESSVWHVECQVCGARRSMKEVKDRQKFPSHPARKTPPPKGEERWALREEEWKLVKD